MFEVLDDPEVLDFTRKVMLESAGVLMVCYPGEFTREGLRLHIDDLLERFRNRNLRDTVFRVGSDLKRKLGADDRFMGIIRMAEKSGLDYSPFVRAMAMGFHFRATDEQGTMWPGDADFHRMCEKDLDRVLKEVCGVNPRKDAEIYGALGSEIRKIPLRST